MLAEDVLTEVFGVVESNGQSAVKNPDLEVNLGKKRVFKETIKEINSNVVMETTKLNLRQSAAVKFVNYTSHRIKVMDEEENIVLDLKPAKRSARIRNRKEGIVEVAGVPIATELTRKVENLPPPQPGVLYVVSGYVKNVLSCRTDLVSPDTSDHSVVLDNNGNIEAVRRLTR
ncbi:hypothetical protein MWH25_08720 [Natroniella acetigena]|uniref:hypothetical protein n=1 Tax=Natroniella acetigena TaxID=52004 RepID=UPI00200AA848|nr:hypothetical protein [Natroniella acetigena]MCK8827822.1 hypothetical protein [Natroniella acetigena]